MSEEKKFVAVFDEDEVEDIIELDEEEVLEDSEMEPIDDGALEEVEASGGAAGDWIRLGRFAYMVVAPLTTRKCEYFTKGPNKFKGIVKLGTCSCCTKMFTKKGYWLCAKSKTELPR